MTMRGARLLELVAFGLLGMSGLASRPAFAEPCGRPDVDATYPPSHAAGVPPNALLSAHYAAPAEYLDEPVILLDAGGTDVTVDVAYDSAESMLRATPLSELAPGTYELSWPALRGVSTNRGLGLRIEFSVGSARDEEPPRFDGLRGVEWDLSREHDPCTDTREDRFRYELAVGGVADDIDPALLAVIVFETRGSGSGSAPEQIAIRPLPEHRRIAVERPATGGEKVCFAAVTRDLVNNVSGGGDREACVETTELPFFNGCSLAPAVPRRGFGVTPFALAACVTLRRRRARRG